MSDNAWKKTWAVKCPWPSCGSYKGQSCWAHGRALNPVKTHKVRVRAFLESLPAAEVVVTIPVCRTCKEEDPDREEGECDRCGGEVEEVSREEARAILGGDHV